MITKHEFDFAAKTVAANFAVAFPKMISYKSFIQKAILDVATNREIEDVRYCRINQGMIDKLCRLAKMSGYSLRVLNHSIVPQWLWLQSLTNMTGVRSTL